VELHVHISNTIHLLSRTSFTGVLVPSFHKLQPSLRWVACYRSRPGLLLVAASLAQQLQAHVRLVFCWTWMELLPEMLMNCMDKAAA
jgi:hypothetical protein